MNIVTRHPLALYLLLVYFQIVNQVWYYVSMVYDAPTLDLYVTVGTEFPTCGGATPGATCSPAATATQTGRQTHKQLMLPKQVDTHTNN